MIFKQKRGAKVMAEKKYVIDNAELMAEWDWKKNNELGFDPKVLTLGSNKKVWWECNKGHEWQATIKNRNKGNGCPYCSSRFVLIGYNDLQTANPSLAKEWNFEKNFKVESNFNTEIVLRHTQEINLYAKYRISPVLHIKTKK